MPLQLDTIQSQLTTRWLGRAAGWENELWDTIDSTNNRVGELAGQGAPAGLMVFARQQTAGRGRQGRQWISPPDAGLFVSFLLRPAIAKTQIPLHTLAAGVAAAHAVEECCGLRIGLKWVNDLVADGRKLGGILAEMPSASPPAAPTTAGPGDLKPALVLGIGINLSLNPDSMPEEIRDRVTSLESLSGQPVDVNLLAAYLAARVESAYEDLESGQPERILDAWRQRSVTLGRQIRAVSAGSATIEGLAVDIAESGGLIVETAEQGRVTLHAGEITIRGIDGSYA